jgi:hypothetical protein
MRTKKDIGISHNILIKPTLMINIVVKATYTKVVILGIMEAI